MAGTTKTKPFFTRRRIVLFSVLLALIVLAVAMIATRPSQDALVGCISEELRESAGAKYSETYLNFGILNVARGRDIRSGSPETYLGAFGQIFDANDGAASAVANISLWMPSLIKGTGITISLTVVSVLVGVVLALFLALGKMSKILPIKWFCSGYIFFFRGTPLLMQLYFVYYGLPLISSALAINNRFMAAFIAFALNSGAYVAELIRAALQSIDKGQYEAAKSLGLSYAQTMGLVIVPQSIRRLIPPVANEFIMVIKDASLVSLIALTDLSRATQTIMNNTFSVLVYVPAIVLYLVITAVFTKIFNKLEQRYSVYQ
ncbi:MAG: amino acid ABC transporter permease [Oscillospiraceae bacterium]|jgi:polar amino acid transport system permease protein|nr:amino acid ABC transporter permease [Oscillospiraceae bacterium]